MTSVLTENSVHISCGTLIVDLVELATVTTIVLDLGDREPLRRTVDECFHAQGVRGAKEFRFGSTRVWLVRSMRSGIFAQEGNVEATGLLRLSGASLISVV